MLCNSEYNDITAVRYFGN